MKRIALLGPGTYTEESARHFWTVLSVSTFLAS